MAVGEGRQDRPAQQPEEDGADVVRHNGCHANVHRQRLRAN